MSSKTCISGVFLACKVYSMHEKERPGNSYKTFIQIVSVQFYQTNNAWHVMGIAMLDLNTSIKSPSKCV